MRVVTLGLGAGWRREIALDLARRRDLGFVEVLAETVDPQRPPPALLALARRVAVVVHGVGLSLGGADEPDQRRISQLARLAERFGAPLITEHAAFVRGGALDSGHLLPLPRTRAGLDVLVANVRLARAALPVPLGLENVAALFEWPDAEMSESEFLTEAVERSGALLLLDLANLHANAVNFGFDAARALDELPLDRLAYLHVAGGVMRSGFWHDTHAHAVPPPVLALLEEVYARVEAPGVVLERDALFPPMADLAAELDAVAAAMQRGRARRLSQWQRSPEDVGRVVPDANICRDRVAAAQDALLAALLGQGLAPARFDARQLALASRTLEEKRKRASSFAAARCSWRPHSRSDRC